MLQPFPLKRNRGLRIIYKEGLKNLAGYGKISGRKDFYFFVVVVFLFGAENVCCTNKATENGISTTQSFRPFVGCADFHHTAVRSFCYLRGRLYFLGKNKHIFML